MTGKDCSPKIRLVHPDTLAFRHLLLVRLNDDRERIDHLDQEVSELRKRRDHLIRTLTSPPHNLTYRAVAEAAGVSTETVRQVRLKGEQT